MREPALQTAGGIPAGGLRAACPPRPQRRPDRLELALLAAFAAASLWVVALDLWQVLVDGRVWTGTDGSFIVDQMQYLAWIVSASHHLLVANLFVLRSTPADYFQPAIAISGILTALGLTPTLSLLIWKPVAVVSLFYAVRAYAHRGLRDATRAQRLAVIALGMFFGSFTLIYGKLGVVGDLTATFLSWGYPFALMGVAAAIFALLAYERARADGRVSWRPALLGALAASLHPWQGELLIVIIVGAEALSPRGAPRSPGLRPAAAWRSPRLRPAAAWRSPRLRPVAAWRSPRLRLAAVTITATIVPLVYYGALGKLDLSWELARLASKHSFPALAIVGAIGPLLLVALLGYRRSPAGFLARATRLWLPAACIVYVASASTVGATPLHAFDGITIPLAVLAVDGYRSLQRGSRALRRAIGAALVVIGTVPATVDLFASERGLVAPAPGNANFITRDESRALAFLRHDRERGGVMTSFYLGATVPARTDRATYVGDCIWSQPRCNPRAIEVQQLLNGALLPAVAQIFVSQSHARFVLADCQERTELSGELGSMIASERHFGCATVYTVRSVPLPESVAYAASVRAPRRK